ncbi:MAG: hypothetical protein WEG40_20820 [Candidatus Rokuibacteriota bacterium]
MVFQRSASAAWRIREVFGHFDEICRRLERLEQEYYAMSGIWRR